MARVAEMVDARDLKSLVVILRAGSIPAPGTNKIKGLAAIELLPLFCTRNLNCNYFVTILE